jgi:hypothetical protein
MSERRVASSANTTPNPQIYVDILRTHQSVALFQQEAVQKVRTSCCVCVRVVHMRVCVAVELGTDASVSVY